VKLHFLGAARQVTGSRYLLEANGLGIMVDCGLFQERAYTSRNWQVPLVDPGTVDVLLLTHAHLDHTGLVPRLVSAGYDGPIFATEPTVDLAEMIMIDSAEIQEEDAAYKRRRHKREHRRGPHPEIALYTTADARAAARLLRPVRYGEPVDLGANVRATFHEAGHILGSAIVEIEVGPPDGPRNGAAGARVVFSGDIGQWDKPLIGDPTLLPAADWVVMESTYGNRLHRDDGGVAEQLAEAVTDTVRRGGNLVIPTFALERAQELMFHFSRLVHQNRIPDLPIYLDSPMAVDVTELFRRHRAYLDDETRALLDGGEPPLRFPGLHLVRSSADSRAINDAPDPKVIMSTSGMCTAGRIKHHLRRNVGRPESTILFVGYQPKGTLGRRILDREKDVRIHGRNHRVRADVRQLSGMSAHGDRDDLLRWLGGFREKPRHVFLTHGEHSVARALAHTIKTRLGIETSVPEYRHAATLE